MNKISSLQWPGKLPVGAALLVIGFFYFIFFPVNYDFDGTVFSHYLRYGLIKGDLAAIHQPQHPLNIPFNYIIYKGLNAAFGYNPLEYFHLQLFSFFFGLMTLWFCYKILRQITDLRYYHTAGMFLIAASYGIWYYSVAAEVHIAGLFFVTAGVYLLFFKPGKPDGIGRMMGAACLFALAAGFHITNGLIAVSALLIFIIEKRPFTKILQFCAFYAFFLLVELSAFSLLTKIDILESYKNQLTGNDIMAGYKISYWADISPRAIWEFFHATANAILFPSSPWLSIMSVVLFLAAAAFIVYRALKPGGDKKTFLRMGAWILTYMIFFFFWDQRNLEFKLHIILPFLVLLTGTVAGLHIKRNRLVQGVVIAIILSIGLMNFYSYMLPANDIENNRPYKVAEAIGVVTPPQSIIVVGGCGDLLSTYLKIYVPYFAHRRVHILDWMLGKGFSLDQARLYLEKEARQGAVIYFFSDVLHRGKALDRLLANHKINPADYFNFISGIHFTQTIGLSDGYYLNRMGGERPNF